MSPNATVRRITPPILLVDDNPDDVEATKRAFKSANLPNRIEHAASGEDALVHLRSDTTTRPAIILLDLNMPGLGGRKTLEQIKANPKLRKIPIVILTTSDDAGDVKACYALGANTYIQKPVDFDGLIAAMGRLKEYWFEVAVLPKDEAQ